MGESAETPAGSGGTREQQEQQKEHRTSGVSRYARGVWHHRTLLARSVAGLLVAIVVLQNLEATEVDFLFWSFLKVPKLVLMLVSMLVGAVAWELGRRALSGKRRDDPGA